MLLPLSTCCPYDIVMTCCRRPDQWLTAAGRRTRGEGGEVRLSLCWRQPEPSGAASEGKKPRLISVFIRKFTWWICVGNTWHCTNCNSAPRKMLSHEKYSDKTYENVFCWAMNISIWNQFELCALLSALDIQLFVVSAIKSPFVMKQNKSSFDFVI